MTTYSKDPLLRGKITEIANNEKLTLTQKRVEVGKAVRKRVNELGDEGMSNVEIADLLELDESRVRDLLNAGPPKGDQS